jgi:HKD family nuclease
MLVKKLLARFINDKVLQNAEYCYITTDVISMAALDLFMGKVGIKCKVDIVTGLGLLTSPDVLRKILANYRERVRLRIYTKNTIHAKVFAFDLPYRKRLAFIGSGNFTIEGLAENEELSWQTSTEKEVEELKIWFNKYFEDSIQLVPEIIIAYEPVYQAALERWETSDREKKQFMESIAGLFNIDPTSDGVYHSDI